MSASRLAVLSLAVLTSACTTIENRPVGDELAARLAGRTVGVGYREPGSFGVMLTRLVALGPLGVPGMVEEGGKMREQLHLVDPAPEIAMQQGDVLQGRLGANVQPPLALRASADPAAVVAAAPAGVDYVLEVTTLQWGVGNLPAPRSSYFVSYTAQARLIDARSRAVVAEGGCVMPLDGTEFTGPLAELTRDDGALLKSELSARADRCVRRLRSTLLGP